MEKCKYVFKLYIAGVTPQSNRAEKNIRAICQEYLKENSSLEIVDILEDPQVADDMHLLAIPTLIKFNPKPVCRIIGDLSNIEIVLNALDIISVL